MKPHLVRWHKQYEKKGLAVIDVNDGEFDTFEELKEDVKKSGRTYPTLWDHKAQTTGKYGVEVQPAGFLIGVDGKVIWEGTPVQHVKKIEAMIKAELKKVKKKPEAGS